MRTDWCPLTFEPRLLPKIWGGRGLGRWGKKLPPAGDIGESWELFDDAQGSPPCCAGPDLGRSLAEVAAEGGTDFYGPGKGAARGRFPLLIKLLDAREALSIQVHPTDELAQRLHGPEAVGKSELWVVLEAAPGARILNGFKPGVTWPRLKEAVAAGKVADLLHAIAVRTGDVLDIPAGRPHALGAGCMVAEIQQNSDWTYRLWDYGRLENGRPRPLHLKEAEQALRFDAVGSGRGLVTATASVQPWGLREGLVSNSYFAVERWTVKPGAEAALGAGLSILIPLSGDPRPAWGASRGEPLKPGRTTVVPAVLPVSVHAGAEGAVFLRVQAV